MEINNLIVLFADVDGNHAYSDVDLEESLYTINRGAIISGFCFSVDCTIPDPGNYTRLDITFKRPNPDGIIYAYNGSSWTSPGVITYDAILIKGTDGSTRQVIVRSTGQVSVQE